MDIKITSPTFKEGDMIPKKYTCDDQNISPPLVWTSVPEGTKSIALICDDPDAPFRTCVHWVLFNLPPDITELSEGVPPEKELDNGAKHGATDFARLGYDGPCPLSGTHRYYFKLYALDKEIALAPGATKSQLMEVMEGHILGQGQLMGKYQR